MTLFSPGSALIFLSAFNSGQHNKRWTDQLAKRNRNYGQGKKGAEARVR